MDPISQPDLPIWRISRLEGLLNHAMNEATEFDLQMKVAFLASIQLQFLREAIDAALADLGD